MAALQAPLPDTAPAHLPQDTVVVTPPVPAIQPVFDFLMEVPQWIQIGGAVVGVLVAAVLAVWLWQRRARIAHWVRSRSRGWKIAAVAAVALVAAGAAGAGLWGWNYVQHENAFCNSCHVMNEAYMRFAGSEHRDLQCHDCHQQPISASVRQLVLWVADRPEEIGEHAPVPNHVCGECHLNARPDTAWLLDSVWVQVSRTAGHRIHLESDSASLKDIQCADCHGTRVHRFIPVDQTCLSSGCHEGTEIRLGKMAEANVAFHCTACHEFTAELTPALARGREPPERFFAREEQARISPSAEQCLSCHQMREILTREEILNEPHRAACGVCHDPHEQTRPEEAGQTCAAAGCHDRADTLTAFHRGIGTEALADCVQCHGAHTFQAQGENCLECHQDIFQDRGRAASGARTRRPSSPHPPVAFEYESAKVREYGTAARSSASVRPIPPGVVALAAFAPHGVRGGPLGEASPAVAFQQQAQQQRRQASFPGFAHSRHRNVRCQECHSMARTHGELTVTSTAQCQQCHHTAPVAAQCAACHRPAEYARQTYRVSTTMRFSVGSPATRALPFEHARHRSLQCQSCHRGPPALAASVDCASCHREHHAADAQCIACHTESPRGEHNVRAHLTCTGSGCHEAARVAFPGGVPRNRNFCLACHQDMVRHEPGGNCAQCHRLPPPRTALAPAAPARSSSPARPEAGR